MALALLPRSLAISPESLVPGLAVLGIGLGLFTPANNAMVMGAIPPGSSGMGGGLVNMGRGLGTSLGVAVVTLTLHVTGGGLGGAQWVLGLLGVVAVLVAATAWHSGGGQPASTAATWSGDSGSPSADPQA